MLTVKAMTGGEGYAANHLSNSDYYAEGETVIGQWMGRGAELLGLEGQVTMEQFEAMREAVHPLTGEFLRQRKSADRVVERTTETGETIVDERKARNLYDCTVSAPKALSVLAMVDPRVTEAHQAGVSAIVQEMEGVAGARIRKHGANDTRITSNLVIARYDHTASRALDPQIHTHLVAGNLTFDGVENVWKALDATQIYLQAEYLTEVYRNAAGRVLNRLGYQIEDRFEHGKDNGFGIVGIQEATLEKFSRRTEQKEAAIQEFIRERGRQPSKNEISQLVRETRDPKLKAITTEEVIAQQRARLSPDEVGTLESMRQAALARGSLEEHAVAAPSLAFAREHIFERLSVAKDYELKMEALRHGRGRIELPDLKAAVLSDVASGAMLTARGEVATQQTLERERRMVATVNKGIGQHEALGRGRQFVVSDRLGPEQKSAVLGALASRDFAFHISGAAGVGKTTLLKDLKRGLSEARRSVVAVAPSTSAVEELQKQGFPQAMTIARLLVDPQQRAELAGQVLIVDEAGMVGSRDMDELLQLAQSKGARLVTVGDTKQIKSVEQGDALRILERSSNLNGVSVRKVQRQLNEEYKAAVEALRKDPTEGYRRLETMGAIREVHWREVGLAVSQAYRESSAVPNAKGQIRSVLVIAATHEEIRNVTHAIRADLKRAGQLTEGQEFTKHTALNWTEAQKKRTQNYQPGQVLTFHKAVKGVAAKNESLEVVRADRNGITARRANGQDVQVRTKESKTFGMFEKQDIEVSAGDKLLLQANWKDKTFKATNGELVTVARVQPGVIDLSDGRRLAAGYRQFTHGYAVTAHRSQGKTVDFEIIAAKRMDQDLFYVSATRAREGLTVVTSDSLGLQESIGASGDRQSAIELAERAARIKAARPAGHRFEPADFQLYQRFQQQQSPALQPKIQHEVTRNVRIDYQSGIGF